MYKGEVIYHIVIGEVKHDELKEYAPKGPCYDSRTMAEQVFEQIKCLVRENEYAMLIADNGEYEKPLIVTGGADNV